MHEWQLLTSKPDDVNSAIHFLVLAIGLQSVDGGLAHHYFVRARELALLHLTNDTSPSTVKAFLLVSVYMLRGCQTNGAFLYFGLAARASLSVGMHRTEINARFGNRAKMSRERLYKSLKVVDLFISVCLGRPPALYDLDCTVAYKVSPFDCTKETDCLDDTLQILLIVETIVIEVYSRRKISLQLTNAISQQLKEWASLRLPRLLELVASPEQITNLTKAIGACQTLSAYYYAIVLVSRPFLMFETYRRLAEKDPHRREQSEATAHARPGRAKLAEGCIDAACCLVDMVSIFCRSGAMPHLLPFIV